jgi:hypothetical protein
MLFKKNIHISLLCILLIICHKTNAQLFSQFQNYENVAKFTNKQTVNYFHDTSKIKLNPEYVIKNESTLFRRHIQNSGTNISKNPDHDIWLNFSVDTIIHEDFIVKCLPYYDRVSLFYYNQDSVLQKSNAGYHIEFSKWPILSNMLIFKVPAKSINKYFLKFEINDSFLIGAYEIINFEDFINYNTKNFIFLSILITSLLIAFFTSIIHAAINKELKSLFYGLFVLFFASFTVSAFHLWNLIPFNFHFEHKVYDYYVPFSLSSVFFGLHIYFSFKNRDIIVSKNPLIYTILIKIITVILPIFDLFPEWITYDIFTKLDPLIFIFSTSLVYENYKNDQFKNKYYLFLLLGSALMAVAQTLHLFYNLSDWIFGFMFLQILVFGVLLAFGYRQVEIEKIKTLNELIEIKTNYNSHLEQEVHTRTEEINENLKTIDALNKILQQNNLSLQDNVKSLTEERLLNKELNFEAFKLEFPDRESCQKMLVKLRWGSQFICNHCGNKEFVFVKKNDPYLRKCTKCGKIHSATTDTLFHNIKFPLEKAFYITFLSTSSKKYSLEKIGEMVDLRTATVWNFKKKVDAAIEEKKFYKNPDMTWQDLIL